MQKEQKKISNTFWYYILGFIAITVLLMFTFAPASKIIQDAEGGLCMKTCRDRLAAMEAQKAEEESPETDPVYVSIMLSSSCLLSQTTDCPTYKWLADNFDNSDREIFGDFIRDEETGMWMRDEPIVDQAYNYYLQLDKQFPRIIWVDPDPITLQGHGQKVIWIEPEVLTYMDPPEHIVGLTDTGSRVWNATNISGSGVIISYHDIFINGCSSATVGWYPEGKDALVAVLDYFMDQCTGELDYPLKQFHPAPTYTKNECDSISQQYDNFWLMQTMNARENIMGIEGAHLTFTPCIPEITDVKEFKVEQNMVALTPDSEFCEKMDFLCRQKQDSVMISTNTARAIEVCDFCPKWFSNNITWLTNGAITEQEFMESYSWLKYSGDEKYVVESKLPVEEEEIITPDVIVTETVEDAPEVVNQVNATSTTPETVQDPNRKEGIAEWYDINADGIFFVRINLDGEARAFDLFYVDQNDSSAKNELDSIMSACPVNSTIEVDISNNDVFCHGSKINH